MHAVPRRELLVDGGIVLAAFVVFFVVWSVMHGIIETDIAAITRAHTTIREGNEAVAVLAKLKQDAPKAEAYTKQFELLLPKREELLGFTRALSAGARASNVDARFGFQDGAVPGGEGRAGFIAFNLDVTGSYQDATTFLDSLESRSNRFLLTLGSLSFEPYGGGYRFHTQGKLFFRQE